MTGFVLVVSLMAAAAVLLIVPALTPAAPRGESGRARQNLRIARERLAELKAGLADGSLDGERYARERDGIGRVLLDDLHAAQEGIAAVPTGRRWTPWLLVVALPALAAALYIIVGTPSAIGNSERAGITAMHADTTDGHQASDRMILRLAQRLQDNPADVDGWLLLGRSQQALRQYQQAVAAFARARKLAPGDAAVQGLYSQAVALRDGAVAADGPPGAKGVEVVVSLDPALRGRVDADDSLFVYARAVDGPPMPLAVLRKKASDLPLRITLDDSMAMTPSLRLSAFDRVQVGARISKTANAIAARGDLGSTPIFATPGQGETVRVVINQPID